MAASERERPGPDEERPPERAVPEDDDFAAGDPEVPDTPLGVPEEAEPGDRPGFPRGDPSQG